ncbi:MAG TPA: hypothetical protein VF546_02625 [Pyrinomonadaceae bacterium]|jgi:hypothetical protein
MLKRERAFTYGALYCVALVLALGALANQANAQTPPAPPPSLARTAAPSATPAPSPADAPPAPIAEADVAPLAAAPALPGTADAGPPPAAAAAATGPEPAPADQPAAQDAGTAGAQDEAPPPPISCQDTNTVTANVVALDQPFMLNRLGAAVPQGMVFALKQDVVPITGTTVGAGNAMLRSDKRPRPMVLRVNKGACLKITFTNYLANPPQPLNALQPVTRQASVHVNGMQLVSGAGSRLGTSSGIAADGSFTGNNSTSLVDPGKTATFTLYAGEEGSFLLYSGGSTFGTNGSTAGQLTAGLFGAVNVEPAQAEYYRSQVTAADLQLACQRVYPNDPNSPCKTTADGHLIINYDAVYPVTHKYACRPVLKMVDVPRAPTAGTCQVLPNSPPQTFYTDLTALITGPNHGRFPDNGPPVAVSPDRNQPFREFTIHYHEAPNATQAFTDFYLPPQITTTLTAAITATSTTPITVGSTNGFPASGFITTPNGETIQYSGITTTRVGTTQIVRGINSTPAAAAAQSVITLYQSQDLSGMLAPGKDNFAINYGTGGIAAEILANRFNVGPMAPCVECKFEEFFLSAWAVGDPATVVDVPANVPLKSPPYPPEQPNKISQLTSQLESYEVFQESKQTTTKPPPLGPPQPVAKATKAYYPDDPSNVYHSYIDDHVVFRILHAGANLTHVHHQHAHQWIHSPNDDNSTYLDSQMLSPGAAFTLEIDYNGSGNRNKTVGDSIFHCHFYPHFAAGMWSLWRTHDVFENGSQLVNGIPVTGTRALPDGEIKAGTPIPALVPLPTLAMAPLPSPVFISQGQVVYGTPQAPDPTGRNVTTSPGFPFFIPGIAGHRSPAPPLDFACVLDAGGNCRKDAQGNTIYEDGGLARHIITGGSTVDPANGQNTERHNQWDFTKDTPLLSALQLAEEGQPVEKVAMAYHAVRNHPSYTPDGSRTLWNGQPANFVTNGLPPSPGAPYADPAPYCPSPNDCDGGPANPRVRRYKAAVVQMNVTFNKKGWHYPQQRFITLWQDVANTLNGTRLPEPFFFRANSYDLIEFWHTDLVPSYYELDDFQVRTPTDIIGQHIHLVKFDVTSSDGAANGWNYEDGTLSAEEVRDRINAIRRNNNCRPTDPVSFRCPQAVAPPPGRFGPDPSGHNWAGAQTTIQRWYADPVLNLAGEDRTLRTVFTHDHFGPSTHQQAGLYAGLVVEPKGSTWFLNDQNGQMNTRDDGGPTSWQARIVTTPDTDSYREFLLEFQDLALAYLPGSPQPTPAPYPGSSAPQLITPGTQPWGWVSNANAINPSLNQTAGNLPKGAAAANMPSTPTIITGSPITGTMSVNYRNEPLPFRVNDPSGSSHDITNPQTDLAYAFSSMSRLDTALNIQPCGPLGAPVPCPSPTPAAAPTPPVFVYPGAFAGASPFDPYTPLLRAYQNDKVQVRVLVGGYLFNHNFGVHGLKWLFEPSAANSGYRDNQAMGISEHFEFVFQLPVTAAVPINPNRVPRTGPFSADYLYMPGSGWNDLNNGLWGILRAYNTGGDQGKLLSDLPSLPNNARGGLALNGGAWNCPTNTTGTKVFNIAAVNAIGNNPLLLNYNSRSQITNLSNALVYVPTNSTGTLLPTAPPTEPLVMRANAGECIVVNLFNRFKTSLSSQIFTTADTNAGAPIVGGVSLYPSARVGLHPQLLSFDVTQSNGVNIGFNPDQVVPPNNQQPKVYQWYAGNVSYDAQGNAFGQPIEFGSTNLLTADPLEQQPLSLVGALIVEPQNSIQTPVNRSNTTVDVGDKATGRFLFREFVAITQENVYLTQNAFNSVNFGSEPMGLRIPTAKWNGWDSVQIGCAYSSIALPSALCGLTKVMGNPQTPIFAAVAGTPVRFRMLHPDGLGGFPDDVWTIHGHVWQEEPYLSLLAPHGIVVPSVRLGNNRYSQWQGARDGFGPGNHFDILIDSAGGRNKVFGDYLYKSFPSGEATAGVWGIFRVCDPASNVLCVAPTRAAAAPSAIRRTTTVASPTETATDPGERFNTRRQTRRLKQQQQRQSPRP